MDGIVELLNTLNAFSPLGVAALLALIIYMLVKGKQEVATKVDTLGENHIHEILEVLQRIELKMTEEFSFIRSRLNHKN